MKIRFVRVFGLLVVAALFVGAAGCDLPWASQSATSATSASSLSAALAFAPIHIDSFAFTDWTQIKSYENLQNVTSQSSEQDRGRFISALVKRQAPASNFGQNEIYTIASTWSFDPMDYVWEATMTMQAGGAPVFVVRLRNNFDLSSVVAHFKARGFSTSSYRNATIYTYEGGLNLRLETDWFGLNSFAFLNTAVLTSEKILILSPVLNEVHTVLDTYSGTAQSLASDSAVRDFTQSLGTVFSLGILPESGVCSELSGLLPDQQTTLQSDLQGAGSLHSYRWLAVGYRYESGHPEGLFALQFASGSDATADLGPRRQIAGQGMSLLTGKPYKTGFFAVDAVNTHHADLVMRVRPFNDEPVLLFDMVTEKDVAFAACPT